MSKIKPLDNRLIVSPDAVKETTDSGILLSTENQKKQSKGLVVAIGPKVENVKYGDYVLYPEYAGITVVTDGEECLILRENEIMAIIEEVS